ncbi:MAG TPA: GH25 family lysozyme [Cyclobacteriaceae bacterium]|nr:GH25 family lysozyme [Cyclobacteriaceae bacterium]
MINGIDTSHHQIFNDYTQLNGTNNEFVFIKASQELFEDPNFVQHSMGFARTKLLRGAYHYLTFAKSGKDQAECFLAAVRKSAVPMDLPPVLDVEDVKETLTPVQCETIISDWLKVVRDSVKTMPIIYTGGWYWRDPLRLNNTENFKGYPLWTSRYPKDVSQGYMPLYGGWTKPTFWQYTEKGSVPGLSIKTPIIDLDFFLGDIDALWKLLPCPLSEVSKLPSARIEAMQFALRAKGYSVNIDGSYASVQSAWNAWQTANGLSQQDSFTPKQWQALFDMTQQTHPGNALMPARPGTNVIPKSGAVDADMLNIRTGAAADKPVAALPLPKGKIVEILDEENGWYKVRTQVEGWVSKDFVKTH